MCFCLSNLSVPGLIPVAVIKAQLYEHKTINKLYYSLLLLSSLRDGRAEHPEHCHKDKHGWSYQFIALEVYTTRSGYYANTFKTGSRLLKLKNLHFTPPTQSNFCCSEQ
jgi:hypothetical protein